MKISELRALLDHTAAEDMKRLVVELYRALPKKTRGSELVQLLVEKLRTPEALELAVERTEQLLRDPRPAPNRTNEYHLSEGFKRLALFGFLAYVKLSATIKRLTFSTLTMPEAIPRRLCLSY